MSSNKKKNLDLLEEDHTDEMDTDTDEEGQGTHPEAYTGNEEIQVDFEGRNPTDSDFDGIRQLLQQLFRKAHINLAELAEIVIGQNYVGSVIIQSEVEEEYDDDDEMYEDNMIFGLTTAVNISAKKDVTCIEQLRTYIVEKAEKHAEDATLTYLRNVLGNDARPIGFLINERFINIPAEISVPLLESLYKEVKKANEKKMNFNFDQYLMILKFYRKEAKKGKPAEDFYSNAEEEIICKESVCSFEYSIKDEAASGMTGDWLEGDSSVTPYRKVILFDANKLPHIILSIRDFISSKN